MNSETGDLVCFNGTSTLMGYLMTAILREKW